MSSLDFILIHSFKLDDNNQINGIHQQRLDWGYWLHENFAHPDIIVAGKTSPSVPSNKAYFERTGITLARGMKDYLVARGISAERIHEEPEGENTYDCTINSFKRIVLPNGWNSGVITSSAEHLPRIMIQTMKVTRQLGIRDEDMRLFYSGPSIEYSGETREEIDRFKKYESEAIAYTLGRTD